MTGPSDHEVGLHDSNGSHLEALLRQEETVLPDEGFTERVLSALPPPARVPRWRAAILACSGILAAAAGLLVLLRSSGVPALGARSGSGAPLQQWSARMGEAAWSAICWAPPQLPWTFPLLPLLVGLAVLAGAFIWALRESY